MAGGTLFEKLHQLRKLRHQVDALEREIDEDIYCAAASGAAQDGAAPGSPPTCAAPSTDDVGPIVASPCPIGRLASGPIWSTVRWFGRLTLLVGPGATLVLDESDIDAIHDGFSRVIAKRAEAACS